MRQYGMLQAVYMSFYSKQLYRDVAMNWGGYAFLYLLFIAALSWIVPTYEAQTAFNHFYTKTSDAIVAQIPVMIFKKGKLITPENRPYIIKEPDSKNIFAVIDTSGKYTTLKDANSEILITQTEMITTPKPGSVRIDQFPTSMTINVNPVDLNQYAKKYLSFAWVLFFPIVVLMAFFYRIIQSIFYAVIGKIFSVVVNAGVSFSQSLMISMVALTPAVIIFGILDVFDVVLPYQGLTCFGLVLFYLFFGILANKK